MIVVRDQAVDATGLALLARAVRRAVGGLDVAVAVNGSLEAAEEAGADILHLPERTLDRRTVNSARRAGLSVGVSVHSLEAALSAVDLGVEYLFFGPVFSTPSKAGFGPPQGLAALATVVSTARVPVVAIGGMCPGRVREVASAGAAGVAAVRAILTADDPAQVVRRMVEELEGGA